MTTKLRVTSDSHGTPKQKKNLNGLTHFLVTVFFAVLALTTMSFTTNDTTKNSEGKKPEQQLITATDSTCCATNKTGNQLETNWLKNKMDYSSNFELLETIDNQVDAAFLNNELENMKSSVAFSRSLGQEINEADLSMNEHFVRTVEAPLYQKAMANEIAASDAAIDKIINADFESKLKASQFTQRVYKNEADDAMDLMINLSVLRAQIKPCIAVEADHAIEQLILKRTTKHIDATSVFQSDNDMDKLMSNCR